VQREIPKAALFAERFVRAGRYEDALLRIKELEAAQDHSELIERVDEWLRTPGRDGYVALIREMRAALGESV
jgi:hypothetical protein